MGGRFWKYVCKQFALHQVLEQVPERRRRPQIRARDCFLSGLLMFLLRDRSLLGAEQRLKNQKGWRRVFKQRIPSDSTVGRWFARFDVQWLRSQLWRCFYQAMRAKMLQGCRVGSWWVIAYDGHETVSSFARKCEKCRRRRIRHMTADGQSEVKIQYYHVYSAASFVGEGLQGIFDFEPVLPGENEVAATTRLMERTAAKFPRFHSINTVDAVYLQAPFVSRSLAAGQHVLAVLKENCPELRDEVLRLARANDPVEVFTEGDTTVTLYEVSDLRLWEEQLHCPLRGVVAEEITRKRYYEGGERKTCEERSLWVWATTLPPKDATARQIWRIGHHRWSIENRGFNVTPRDMGLNHCFKHDPTAMLALLLTLVLAQFLLACFYLRNLKAPLRNRLSVKTLVVLIAPNLPQAIRSNPP